jgi:outer membrane protein assembly factor BamB
MSSTLASSSPEKQEVAETAVGTPRRAGGAVTRFGVLVALVLAVVGLGGAPGVDGASAVHVRGQANHAAAERLLVNWPKYHLDLANTGFNPYETQIGVGNVSTLAVAWQYRAHAARGTPALWHGIIYATGTTHHFPIATVLSALDAATGSVIWTTRITGAGTLSGVTYYNGALYLGTDDYQFRSFSAYTGRQRWSKFLGGIPGNAAVSGGVVYVARNSGTVYAIDARTGQEIWESANYGQLYGAPALSGGGLYVGTEGTDSGVHALDAATGTEIWYFDGSGDFSGASPAVSGGMVYATRFDLDLSLYALDAATGALVWQQPLGTNGVCSSPAVANGVVYASGDGVMQAFDAASGTPLWASASNDVFGSPIVANGVLYAAGVRDGQFYALDAATGAPLWSFASGGAFADPIVANGKLYAGSWDDNLYAFGLGG